MVPLWASYDRAHLRYRGPACPGSPKSYRVGSQEVLRALPLSSLLPYQPQGSSNFEKRDTLPFW